MLKFFVLEDLHAKVDNMGSLGSGTQNQSFYRLTVDIVQCDWMWLGTGGEVVIFASDKFIFWKQSLPVAQSRLSVLRFWIRRMKFLCFRVVLAALLPLPLYYYLLSRKSAVPPMPACLWRLFEISGFPSHMYHLLQSHQQKWLKKGTFAIKRWGILNWVSERALIARYELDASPLMTLGSRRFLMRFEEVYLQSNWWKLRSFSFEATLENMS